MAVCKGLVHKASRMADGLTSLTNAENDLFDSILSAWQLVLYYSKSLKGTEDAFLGCQEGAAHIRQRLLLLRPFSAVPDLS